MTSISLHAPRILDSKQAAQVVGVSAKSLAYMRAAGTGPSYLKVGKRVYYFAEVISAFIEAEDSAAGKDRWLSAAELAGFINISESTLFDLRAAGDGPKFSRRGRGVVYRQSDIVAYLLSCIRYTTEG